MFWKDNRVFNGCFIFFLLKFIIYYALTGGNDQLRITDCKLLIMIQVQRNVPNPTVLITTNDFETIGVSDCGDWRRIHYGHGCHNCQI